MSGFHVFSDRPLPDPASYYGGWKEERVYKWGKIRRALSGWDGQYEVSDLTVMLDDHDRFIRDLDESDLLINASVVVRMITDEGRRALETPRVVFRGVIKECKPSGVLLYQLTIKDVFADKFSLLATPKQIPNRLINFDDFPNCNVDKVKSSAVGYTVATNAAAKDIGVAITGGVGQFVLGQRIKFGSHSTEYTFTMYNTQIQSGTSTTVFTLGTGDGLKYAVGQSIEIRRNANGSNPEYRVITNIAGDIITVGVALGGTPALDDWISLMYADPQTGLGLNPALTANITVGDTITTLDDYSVTTSGALAVPIVYGYITDYKDVGGGLDAGDGQGPMIYVGDRVLTDGNTYSEFLWAGHACHSPSGRPFDNLYFWNEPLAAGGQMFVGGFRTLIEDLATEAGTGGRLCVPGYDNWTDNGFTNSYVEYNSNRYTVLFMRGIFRDWALGIQSAPNLLGGSPFDVNAYGCAYNADGTGGLIANVLPQYRHAIINWFPPKGDPYTTGSWLSSPTFPDDPSLPMIDTGSFDTADSQSKVYVSPDGFQGNFIIGANNERISARELLARFNNSCGVQCGFRINGQFFVDMINTDLLTTTLQTELDWVNDIFTGTFQIEDRARELYNVIPFQHTQDYIGRASTGWRSDVSLDPNYKDTLSIGFYGEELPSPQFQLFMLRGKNRTEDSDYYATGTLTIAAVLALKMMQTSRLPHHPSFMTGPAGFNYDLGQIVPVDHYEGIPAGVVNIRIERLEIDPGNYTSDVEGFDMTRVYNPPT